MRQNHIIQQAVDILSKTVSDEILDLLDDKCSDPHPSEVLDSPFPTKRLLPPPIFLKIIGLRFLERSY